MSEASNVHPSEVGLATPPELTKKELAKLANIIAFFRDDAERAFPVQGIEVMTDPARDVLRERLEALKPGTLVAQRARIERDPYFRHPIPYIIIFRQRDDGSLEFFVYQRTKLIGEDLLGQKFSVALGGHPEADSIRFHPDWSFDTPQSLMACLVQELDEEATFNGLSFSDYSETGGMFTYAHDAFLRDDSDAVGLQHIGIVYTIGLPANVEVECIEEELITVGFRTLEELAADLELPEVNATYDFENWSRICIKSFAERIEATKAAEAVDAMFVSENGHEIADLAPGNGRGRGQTPHFVHVDEAGFLPEGDIGRGLTQPVQYLAEELFLAEDGDADQTWRQAQLEAEEAAGFEAVPPTETLLALYKEQGTDIAALELPEGVSIVQRGESLFMFTYLTHPVEGRKELNLNILAGDPDPVGTLKAVQAEVLKQWTGATEPEPNGTTFDFNPKVAPAVGQFAQEIIAQVSSVERDESGVLHVGVEVDPSPETQVLTEAHREIGTTDDQMKFAVDELTRISDSVQPVVQTHSGHGDNVAGDKVTRS